MTKKQLILALAILTQCISSIVSQEPIPASEFDQLVLGATILSLADAKDVFKDAEVKLPAKAGVILAEVTAHGPAHNAGLTKMDVIIRINKTPVTSVDEFKAAVKSLDPSKECELTGYRAIQSKAGKVSWKRGSVKTTPVKLRDLFLNAMRTKADEVRETVSYTHRDSTEFVNTSSEFYCYVMTSKNSKPTLRLHIQYVAEDWLFVRRFTIKAGESTFALDASDLGAVERDNDGGKIWEWYDRPVEPKLKEMLLTVIKSSSGILRFEGDKYQKDIPISDDDRGRLTAVMALHEILSNE